MMRLHYHNRGGRYFLSTSLVRTPSAPVLRADPPVREFAFAEAARAAEFAPTVVLDGRLDPLANYVVTAELGEGLASTGTCAIASASAPPLAVDLKVYPDPASSFWTRTGTNLATVVFRLYEDGVEKSAKACSFRCVNPKPAGGCDCCAEGTRCDNGCVAFSQRFGSSPRYPSLPAGRVAVRADRPNDALWTTGALLYDHPMMRRIHSRRNLDAVILDGLGNPTEYVRGLPAGVSAGEGGQFFRDADGVTRITEEMQGYALLGGAVWRGGSRTVRTSDPAIAPLVTESYAKVSGLALTNITESFTVDVRGNTNRTWSALDPSAAKRTTWTSQAGVGNIAFSESVDGVTVRCVDAGCVTNTTACDAFRRQTATTDGRGNRTSYAYDALGRLASQTDAATNTAQYAYDAMGRVASVTNALGGVTLTRYDLRGNKSYEGGATYPVSFAYDVYGNRTSMTTYRDESSGAGDTTTWAYDESSGLVTNKVYADGMGPTYAYDANGRLVRRTWARGVTTTYSYDGWGNLTNTVYSDNTPSVSLAYDAFGRKVAVTDAAGTTTFAYDDYGSLTNETWAGLGNRVLTRHWDAYGRNVGYSVNGVRKTMLGYDAATGRLVTMNEGDNFTWQYLPGTELKSKVTYPNGVTVDYAYEPQRDLLTSVRNYRGSTIYSEYIYENNALGRRMSKNSEQYGYNAHGELTSATGDGAYAYQYDDIGNRETSTECGTNAAYFANCLNQYTNVEYSTVQASTSNLQPLYDADGNQTLVKTSTGIWSVTYNGENRPVCWSNGTTVVTMDFDSMGRRTFYRETVNVVQTTFTRFFYDGYLMIQQLYSNAPYNVYKEFVWDPTEPIVTKPLCFRQNGQVSTFLTHDGNKNVSDVIAADATATQLAHYDYAPFGAVTSSTGARASDNPYRFSSEFFDDTLGLVYYNFRHYEPMTGRWLSRDPIGAWGCLCAYACSNRMNQDILGMKEVAISGFADTDNFFENWPIQIAWRFHSVGHEIIFSSVEVLKNNIDQTLGECDCVNYLQITAHGASAKVDDPTGRDDSVSIHVGKDSHLFESEDDNGISGFLGDLKSAFCEKCEIVLYSCYLGQSSILENRIKQETGCKVRLFNWAVNPLFGNDWIDRFVHEAPRVPTIGMPGMLSF